MKTLFKIIDETPKEIKVIFIGLFIALILVLLANLIAGLGLMNLATGIFVLAIFDLLVVYIISIITQIKGERDA